MTKRLIALLAAAGGISLLANTSACGDDESGSTSGNSSGTAVGCEPSNPACPALAVESDCLALTDNSGRDVFALRLSQLSVTAPNALTSDVVYNIIADGVNINLQSCNVAGMGTFSMIAQFDKTTGKLKIGGAFPEANPENGYCFIDDPANEVAPVEVDSNLAADGSFETEVIDRIVVPIYVDMAGTQIVYLPLRQGRFLTGKVSADQNCVGSFNGKNLKPEENCEPKPDEGLERFINGASLEGFITLEEADAVDVDLVGSSLCVLLSGDGTTYGDGADPIQRCKRDNGAILLKGDWCSTTNSAGGCQDAFRLEAELAASAVEVRTDCP